MMPDPADPSAVVARQVRDSIALKTRIQESHITAGHIISYLVEQNLFGTSRRAGASDE